MHILLVAVYCTFKAGGLVVSVIEPFCCLHILNVGST